MKANKFEKNITTTVAIAALCTIAGGVYGQQTAPISGTSQTDQSQYQQNQVQRVPTADARIPDADVNAGQPMRLNKASGFIGAAVENPQGDRLGKIDDVVLDFNAGRVSYCVLSVDHKMFSAGRYIALPMASLKPSADGTKLILNANKDQITQAHGFDRNNWPSVNTPAWGARSPFVGANANGNFDRDVNADVHANNYRNPNVNVDANINSNPKVDVNSTAHRTVNGNYPDGNPNHNANTNVIVNSNTNVSTLTKVPGRAYDYQTTNSISTNSTKIPAGNR